LLSEAKPSEIAAAMGMALGSVHTRAHQLGLARRALRACASPAEPAGVACVLSVAAGPTRP
jgi:DNA-directed RNA polymerase specialized sigma24 family protein